MGISSPFTRAAADTGGSVRIEKADIPAVEATLGWIGSTDAELAPLGEISGRGDASLATVRGGWSADVLKIEVDVADADHVPAPDGTRLWAADSVEVRIDMAPEAHPARAEWKLIFGLLADGPAARQLVGPGKIPAEALEKGFRIERLETPARTRYHIELPWALLSARAGVRPTLRLVSRNA